YDSNDNLLGAADSHGTYTMSYDSLDRMKSQAEPFGVSITFTYDKADNRTLVQDSFGGVLSSVYDAADRLVTRMFGGTGQTQYREDFTSSGKGRIWARDRALAL